MTISELWLACLIFVAAVLYSSVGHGGALGYFVAVERCCSAATEIFARISTNL